MTAAPLVSILVPTYNGARFLPETLRSALTQTHTEIEVLVGDDASTDETPRVLSEFAAADPRVRVIRHESNIGPYENPIRLLEAARGEYVKFLLHDDLLAPECVEELLAGLLSHPGVTLAFSHRSMIDGTGQLIPHWQSDPIVPLAQLIEGRVLGDRILEACRNVIGELTTCLFRRNDVELSTLWELDGRQLAALGDLALFLGLMAKGQVFYTPRTLSSFRLHESQRSRDRGVNAGGPRDWALLVDWGRRNGFLRQESQQRLAHASALQIAANVHAAMATSPDGTASLEAMLLSLARLIEMRTTIRTDTSRPLYERAHSGVLLERLAQEIDVWSQVRPVAVSMPALDAAEATATVQALRQVRAARAARRFVVAVHPEDLDDMVPLLEEALAAGPDIDVELVPVESPDALPLADWLAVTPRTGTWHRGRAAAVWAFDLPAPSATARPA